MATKVVMDRETHQTGLDIPTAVPGEQYVRDALVKADDFSAPLQNVVIEYSWASVRGEPDGRQRPAREVRRKSPSH
ncbi:hypothetical protein BH09ACT7_BH09ACT7_23920 [soil metagenome]